VENADMKKWHNFAGQENATARRENAAQYHRDGKCEIRKCETIIRGVEKT